MNIYSVIKKRQNAGFSLIELLVAFSLITIVSGVGFASFAAYSQRQIVVQATADLKQTVDLARFNAASFVKPDFCETGELQSYKIRFCHSPATCLSSVGEPDYQMTAECSLDGERVIQERSLPNNVNMTDVAGGTGDCSLLVFNIISTIVEGTPCQINLSGYTNNITLSVNDIGHASY